MAGDWKYVSSAVILTWFDKLCYFDFETMFNFRMLKRFYFIKDILREEYPLEYPWFYKSPITTR